VTPAHLRRGGTYYRVCDPSWSDPADTSFSRRYGGRWNPPGEFGALYLNADIAVAAANARRSLASAFGDAAAFTDIRPERRPDLQLFTVTPSAFVDAVTPAGIAALGLPAAYPHECEHDRCRAIARTLHAAGEPGISARSVALPAGEELAIFDARPSLARRRRNGRRKFSAWYPGLV
jgi:RES domain-containing protein